MSLPIAAGGAIALALLELSVAPSLKVAGLTPDLVLVAVIAIAAFFGLERAIVWAFVGGLMLDLLSGGPFRPVGATPFTLLVIAAIAAFGSRVLPSGRVAVTIALAFGLAVVYHLAVLFFISLKGVSVGDPLQAIVPVAVFDAALMVPLALLATLVSRRMQNQENLGW